MQFFPFWEIVCYISFMLDQISFKLPAEIESAVLKTVSTWNSDSGVERIWKKDASVWTGEDEAKWLGWLDSVAAELGKVSEYKAFAKEAESFQSIVLLGMGGSSLCPEVLAETFGKENFHILDSTVPAQIMTLEGKLDIAGTLFIVASKSGSTLEPNTFYQYFHQRVKGTVGVENAGNNFAAITDPGSKLEKIAKENNFRKIFYGDPTIGGRFSALSPFGMAAGAAMGLDVEQFLANAQEMVDSCKTSDAMENPGAMLGIILGNCNRQGRDKLTIFTSPEIYDVGAWLEQLIAESTGKQNRSIIPIDLEPIEKPDSYSDDRIFAYLKLRNTRDDSLDEKIALLGDSGFPVVKIVLDDKMNLGQEFFRWEFATAVAGAIMKINPFDQPDVESAKIEAKKLTEEYEKTGELPKEEPFFEAGGIKLFSSSDYAKSLEKYIEGDRTVEGFLEAHLAHIQENDYFALLAYVERNEENIGLLQEFREKVFNKKLAATALGFGPRFLHSTGQAYKGGANNGVFLQITSDDAQDLEVPGQDYTFGVVKSAQARGDFQVLLDRKRRALRMHFDGDAAKELRELPALVD